MSYSDYESNEATFTSTFTDTVVSVLSGISSSDVSITGVISSSSSSYLGHKLNQKHDSNAVESESYSYSSSSNLEVDYTVNTLGTSLSTSDVSNTLVSSVNSGNFTSTLQSTASSNGATFMADASSSSVSVVSPDTPTLQPTLSSDVQISLIAIGSVIFAAVLLIVVIPLTASYCMSSPKLKHSTPTATEASSLLGRKKESSWFYDSTPSGPNSPQFNSTTASGTPPSQAGPTIEEGGPVPPQETSFGGALGSLLGSAFGGSSPRPTAEAPPQPVVGTGPPTSATPAPRGPGKV